MKRLKLSLLFISISYFLPLNPAFVSADNQWESTYTTLSSTGYDPQIVMGTDHVLSVIWLECEDIECNRRALYASRDLGDQWSIPVKIISSVSILNPKLVAGINGDLLAAWVNHECEDCGHTISTSWFRNGRWTSPFIVSQDGAAGRIESVVDTKGVATIVWTNAWPSGDIKTARGENTEWTNDHTLCKVSEFESSHSICTGYSLAVDQNDVVTAAWLERKSQNPDALNQPFSSRFEFEAWSPPVAISGESTKEYASLQIASSTAAEFTALWKFDKEAQTSQNYNSAWDTPTSLGLWNSSSYWGSGRSKLSMIEKNMLLGVWGGGVFCYKECYQGPFFTAVKIGGTWSSPSMAPTNMIDLASDGKGHAIMLGSKETYKYNSAGWGQPMKIPGIPYYSLPSRVAIDQTGLSTMLLTGNLGILVKRELLNPRIVTINKEGLGTIISHPNGIDCGDTCAGYFSSGTELALSTVSLPENGYEFHSWQGDCTGSGTCSLTVDTNKEVTAIFSKLPIYKVKVAKPSGGYIIGYARTTTGPSETEIFCPPDCAGNFYKGQTIILEARPKDIFYLKGWRGCTHETDNTCSIVLSKPLTQAKAIFMKKSKYRLEITKNTSGSITSNLKGVYCKAKQTRCVFKVYEDTNLLLTLNPTPGHTYLGWTGDCSGSSSECSLTMNQNKTVKALFE